MVPKDVEKTAFKTPIGNLYYIMMPFGLKNVGVTYQCTITAIFHDMMHRELEDYMDDIVVKSKRREDHVKVLRRLFERCKSFKLRMHPLKCAFGFLVHSKGIDVDPARTIAIATMKSPTTVKELKSFMGKVSYIQRLIPDLVSITLTFTKLLKEGQSFEWGEVTKGLLYLNLDER